MPKSRKHSDLWNHFVAVEEQKASCLSCNAIISFAGGSIGNLSRHLKAKHQDQDLNHKPTVKITPKGGDSEGEEMNAKRTNNCFVCGKAKPVGVYQRIDGCIVPGTFKPIKEILKYFEKIINQRLEVTPKSVACRDCLEYLFNYDRLVRNLGQVQRKIANSLLSCRKSGPSMSEQEIGKTKKPKIEISSSDEDRSVNPKEETQPSASTTVKQEEVCKIEMDLCSDDDDFKPDSDSSDTDAEKTEFTCYICIKSFPDNETMEQHIAFDHTFSNNDFSTCNICGVNCKDCDMLELHMNLHEGKSELECRFCSKKFSQKRNVLRHMELHLNKQYQCEICGKCFPQSWLLYNHRMLHEAEDNALFCDVCQQQFKTKRTLKHHLLTHQADRPRYPCNECDKSFVDKYTLKVHRRVHSQEATSTN